MALVDIPIEFNSEGPQISVELQDEIENRILKLAEGHTDITGAAVAVTQPAESEIPFIVQARIIVYRRPKDVVSIKKDETVHGALKGAMEAVEKQVREHRRKLSETWKRKDNPGSER
jgi:ribosome-associated translation inhibitor RaiA